MDGALHATVVGGDVDRFADRLDCDGVDAVHPVAEGAEFNHDVTAAAVTALFETVDPGAVVMPNSVNGLDYAPAVAARLSLPLVTDAVALDHEDGLSVTREMYGSKVETAVDVTSEPVALTIRGGEWAAAEGIGDAAIEPFDVDVDESSVRSTVRGFEEVGAGDVDIGEAEFIVSVGRGIDEEENLELIEELADALDATLAASRPIVDNGWLPKNRQVGQSGTVVTPTVYLAIGISGAVQHVAGMKGADTIVAINTDPDAPIFDIADYGIVGDLFEVVPELIERFE
jgi:electron transfer flavoprotein alpha subunit